MVFKHRKTPGQQSSEVHAEF